MAVKIQVIHLNSCAATPKTIDLIKKVAEKLGAAIDLESVVVESEEEARKFRHIGSPTVLVNGLDIEPEARETGQFGLS